MPTRHSSRDHFLLSYVFYRLPHPRNSSMMFKQLLSWFKPRREPMKLEDWYEVTWDETFIYRNVSPPDCEPWSDKFQWADIQRICFEAADFMDSDDIHFFTVDRPESYSVPTEAKNGRQLWIEVLERDLFDSQLASEAMSSAGGLYCWPESEVQKSEKQT